MSFQTGYSIFYAAHSAKNHKPFLARSGLAAVSRHK